MADCSAQNRIKIQSVAMTCSVDLHADVERLRDFRVFHVQVLATDVSPSINSVAMKCVESICSIS